MNKKLFVEFWSSEIKFGKNGKEKFLSALLWGVAVFLILFLMRPFGISDNNFPFFFLQCFGYGIVTFVVFVINEFFVRLFLLKLYNTSWKVWNELVLYIIIIPQLSISNYLYSVYILEEIPAGWGSIFEILRYTIILVGIIAFFRIIISLIDSYQRESLTLKVKYDYLESINKLNSVVHNPEEEIILNFEKKEVKLSRDKIIFISAWGNYIKIFIDVNNEHINIVKRGTLKEVEKALNPYQEFYRCHRSYLVNIKYIKRISGNLKYPLLDTRHKDIKVPVSRDKIRGLKKICTILNNSYSNS